jgi:antitoxin MazE
MRKKLTHIGNSLGLVIEKPILDLLNITKDTEVEVSTDGKRLIIEPVRGGRRKRIADAAKRAMDAHESTFRRLRRS